MSDLIDCFPFRVQRVSSHHVFESNTSYLNPVLLVPFLPCMCQVASVSPPNSVTLWTVALQASLSMGFSKQKYWSVLPCSPPGDLLNPGIKPRSCSGAAAAAKSLQSCLTLCDPIDGSHQAPPSLGFSRQEYWSGLPFPSPMHESEKWKWSRSVVTDS